MNDVISIILPVYNAGKYLKRCVDSLIYQTYENLDIIIINDGSTDNSLDILKKYEENDNRIKVFDKLNEGVSHARNIGINSASGQYITFMDADDRIELDMMQNMLSVLKSTNAQVVKCWHVVEYMNKQKYSPTGLLDQVVISSREGFVETIYPMLINTYRLHTCWGSLIDINIIKENNVLFDVSKKSGGDFIFMCNLMTHAKNITLINNPYYHYYITGNSITNSKGINKSRARCQQIIQNYSLLYDFIKKWDIDNDDNKQQVASRVFKEFFDVSLKMFNRINYGVSREEIKNTIKDLWDNELLEKSKEINNENPVCLGKIANLMLLNINIFGFKLIKKNNINNYINIRIIVDRVKGLIKIVLRKIKLF